ncbi:hypothetical protein I3842_02G104300 [Carya illinoinensis]|uniref:EF-hand domain-containing protein n=1 Tax=Carya illinoinensis TaxID=32201 RepID=A0A922FUI5_CARIL|nr:hypothetical protein I3842_02G104300 [Carya illinoinensis]
MDLIGINELRMAAFAYYHNASQDLQKRARAFFDAMDINRDGRVSLNEFITFFREHGYDRIDGGRFREFDRDGDGSLDFYEALTLYYTIKTRSAWCRVCGTWLTRLYFTCVTCFDSGGDTYDLCPACYAKHANNRPHHGPNGHPNIFLDSYVLLRARRGQMPAAPTNKSLQDARDLDAIVADMATTPEAHKLAHSMSKYDYDLMEHARDLAATARDIATTPPEDLEKIYDILEAGLNVADFVTACSIM